MLLSVNRRAILSRLLIGFICTSSLLACDVPPPNGSLAIPSQTPTTSDRGIEFPSNPDIKDGDTVRFRFRDPGKLGLPIYGPDGSGVTYIFRVYPKQQPGYYTTFFWGNDDGKGTMETFEWNNSIAETYYGMHPYPDKGGDATLTHQWELSIEQDDFVNGTVAKGRWYTQAVRVWSDWRGKHHEFYWDLPNIDPSHLVTHTSPRSWGEVNPPAPALTFGDAPWNPGKELCSCILRGIQIYASKLSLLDIQNEIASPQSTAAGTHSIWYLNMNPTPTDISDKSGRGHNPEWVGTQRPALYTGP